jgi:site-specific DNA-adenine methylase
MISLLKVPCSYQGGKQRVAAEIVEHLLAEAQGENTVFYDLCCGSGAVSVELVNRGVSPDRIVMVDNSSWGSFWSEIGAGQFDFAQFQELLNEIPEDVRNVKAFMMELASRSTKDLESETYLLLQACSFGGKQIWLEEGTWKNAFFRDYWEPTATSVRRSPANPMQPNPLELSRRVSLIAEKMRGLKCLRADVFDVLSSPIPDDAIVYIDPPYQNTTGYGFSLDLSKFVAEFLSVSRATLFVSEGVPLADDAVQISFGGAKGGISGNRAKKHEEWLSRFRSGLNAETA